MVFTRTGWYFLPAPSPPARPLHKEQSQASLLTLTSAPPPKIGSIWQACASWWSCRDVTRAVPCPQAPRWTLMGGHSQEPCKIPPICDFLWVFYLLAVSCKARWQGLLCTSWECFNVLERETSKPSTRRISPVVIFDTVYSLKNNSWRLWSRMGYSVLV